MGPQSPRTFGLRGLPLIEVENELSVPRGKGLRLPEETEPRRECEEEQSWAELDGAEGVAGSAEV